MRSLVFALAVVLALGLRPGPSSAWEAATTHAGLTEQAALHSVLHDRLRTAFGEDRGLFAALTVPPADAPALFQVLRTLNPTHGHVPDSRGRLLALGWLAAGSVLADMPPRHAANHFFDPGTGGGLSDATLRGLSSSVRHRLYTWLGSEGLVKDGVAAPEWVVHADNPMNLDGFIAQYARAVASATPAERSRHMAGMLLAAGAILHLLQDMGSPAHVRNDLAAHLDQMGHDAFDVGSRFERVAALAYGRLGVPPPSMEITAPGLRGFFTTDKSTGLADRTSQRFFSAYTLPRSIRVRPGAGSHAMGSVLQSSLVRARPAPLPRLDLEAARSGAGARLVDDQGVCVANYQMRQNLLSWHMDAECMAEQAAVLLPEVAAYSTGLLDWLFRGTIEFTREQDGMRAMAAGAEFGAGTLELFWDDARGVRTRYGEVEIKSASAGQALAEVPPPPKGASAVAVLFRGKDQRGELLVAAGYLAATAAKPGPVDE
jgi:hypothetical protein